MIIHTTNLTLETKEGPSFQDLTAQIQEVVAQSGITNGLVLVFTKHTTSGLRINENEKRLLEDIQLHLEELAPKKAKYLHDDVHLRDCPANERLNGHAHLKSLALNSSETVPLIGGELMLGKWQSILFFELDGGRQREIIVQVLGE